MLSLAFAKIVNIMVDIDHWKRMFYSYNPVCSTPGHHEVTCFPMVIINHWYSIPRTRMICLTCGNIFNIQNTDYLFDLRYYIQYPQHAWFVLPAVLYSISRRWIICFTCGTICNIQKLYSLCYLSPSIREDTSEKAVNNWLNQCIFLTIFWKYKIN